ncbi:MAG TPA: hypothetical protein VJ817_01760 [Gemmatimonadales bacterium]|nr:hypothetical protein [Gemmatimonadales bacterium]
MALEMVGALAIAALVLWLVFEPVLGVPRESPELLEPEAPEETRRGTALLALKEIEFDRETGKLSDQDYDLLKARYSAEALSAIAEEDGVVPEAPPAVPAGAILSCLSCGPRPEPDAVYCSNCGRRLDARP